VVTWWPLLVLAGVLALAGAVLLLRGERTAVYWLWAVDGRLLYIGMTNDVERRMEQHAADKSWWPQVASRTVRWFGPGRRLPGRRRPRCCATSRPTTTCTTAATRTGWPSTGRVVPA
jgi:hypothetical protein